MVAGWRFAAAMLLVTTLVALPGAASPVFPVDFEFETNNGVAFSGVLNATLALAGISYTRDAQATAWLDVEGARVSVQSQTYFTTDSGEVVPYSREVEAFDFTGHITIDAGPDSMLHFLASDTGEPFALRFDASTPVRLGTNRQQSYVYEFIPKSESGRTLLPAAEAGQLQPPFDTLAPSGDATVMVYRAELVFENEEGRRSVPTGPSRSLGVNQPDVRLTFDERTYVVIDARDPVVKMQGGPIGWMLHVNGLTGNLVGDASFTGVEGFSGTPAPSSVDSSLLQVSGQIHVASEYRKESQKWRVTGEATHFGVDGATLYGERDFLNAAAIAISGGIGAAIMLWLSRRLAIQGFAAIVGYNTSEPLHNETRVRMLVLVVLTPGIGVGPLIKALNVRRASILFHAGVLAAAGYITIAKQGAHWRLIADSSLAPLLGAKTAMGSTAALASLQHPVRRTIVDLVASRQASLTFSEIHRACTELGRPMSRQLLQYHLPILVSAGVLNRTQGRVTTYGVAGVARSDSSPYPVPSGRPGRIARLRANGRLATGLPAVLDALAQYGIRLPGPVHHGQPSIVERERALESIS